MQFNDKVAEIYGVENAVMLENLWFWISKNKANQRHCYEGKYWTYNTLEAFVLLFPFWTVKQIRRILNSLEKLGAIEKANWNKSGYNRTTWYAVSAEIEAIYVVENLQMPKRANAFAETGKSISPNGQMEVPKWANGSAQTGKCITDINTDINHIVNTDRESALAFLEREIPTRLEAEKMKYQQGIGPADLERFYLDFEVAVTNEIALNKLAWDVNVLLGRFGKFARNWVSNNAGKAAQVQTGGFGNNNTAPQGPKRTVFKD